MLRNDDYWMRLAIRMAKFGERHGEVPVGALAVDEKQVLLAASFNQTIAACNPIMHAEMIVIQQVAKKLKQIRLKEITLYVTLEPCPMCAGAIREARLKRLVFATRDTKMGAAGTVFNCINHPNSNHHLIIDEGYHQKEASRLLIDFFKKRRGLE